MHISESLTSQSEVTQKLSAAIFDVDGVLLASPHERAWREALDGFGDKARFTTTMYQSQVAGKPRLSGALAALRALGVPNAEQLAPAYAEHKQQRLEQLIDAGAVTAFPDAIRFVRAVRALGWPVAVASSSKNANGMMQKIRLDAGIVYLMRSGERLRSRFAAGQAEPRDFPAGCNGAVGSAYELFRGRGCASGYRSCPRWRNGGARRGPACRRRPAVGGRRHPRRDQPG